MKRIYADNSATTKVRNEVVDLVSKLMKDDFGNPSSLHFFGKRAKNYLDEAREKVSNVINSDPGNIYFTSGGTESNNLVIFGIEKSIEEKTLSKKKHIITTKIEHPSIKTPLEYLEKKGWNISWLNTDKEGFVDLDQLKSEINPETALVSVIHANNEIGTIQNINLISNICKKNDVLFHIDATQSFGKIPINAASADIDFITFSSHKIYGPKGVGGIYINSKHKLEPLIIGGSQEKDIRSGTENLPGIAGFGLAAYLLNKNITQNANYLTSLQLDLINKLSKINNLILTGPKEKDLDLGLLKRLPGHVSFCIKNIEGENIVLQLDLRGIAVSSGSACSSSKSNAESKLEPSHVIKAINTPKEFENGSIRISLGINNTKDDVDYIFENLCLILNNLNKKSLIRD